MSYDADIFDAVEFGDLLSVQMYWTDAININWQDETGTYTNAHFFHEEHCILYE